MNCFIEVKNPNSDLCVVRLDTYCIEGFELSEPEYQFINSILKFGERKKYIDKELLSNVRFKEFVKLGILVHQESSTIKDLYFVNREFGKSIKELNESITCLNSLKHAIFWAKLNGYDIVVIRKGFLFQAWYFYDKPVWFETISATAKCNTLLFIYF